MLTYLLIVTLIIFVALAFGKISNKLGIPVLLGFIALGMIFGSDGWGDIYFTDTHLTEQICTVSLIFIMFYGGFSTKWSEAKPVAVQSALLSSLGVIITAGVVGIFCHYVLKMPFWEGMLVGAVISSTDAASVFSILKSNRLNLKYNTASMLELESGSNDPVAYMLTIFVLMIMQGDTTGAELAKMVFTQIAYGTLFGVVIACMACRIMRKIRIHAEGQDSIFILAVAIIAYAAPTYLNGNGYLSAYLAGIILGNRYIESKASLVHFFDGVTGLVQILIFFLLGLLSLPHKMPELLLPSLAIALFLTFVARPVAIFSVLQPFKAPWTQQILVSWSGLRGATSAVFALLALNNPNYNNDDIFHMILWIVILSIALQGSFIPILSKKLDMLDDKVNVLKTFTDYSDETPMQFVRLSIGVNHRWVGHMIKDILIPPETLFVLLLRGDEKIIPKGDTMVMQGDTLVLSAQGVEDRTKFVLSEVEIDGHHDWLGQSLADIEMDPDKLVIAVKRGSEFIIPSGKTVIEELDVLLINKVMTHG